MELVCLDCGRSNAQLKHDPLGCSGMSEFQPTLLTRLPDSLVGEIVAFGIGFDGNLYVVLAQKPLDYSIEQPGWAVFPKTRPDAPQSYRVLGYDGCTADCIVDFVAREEKYNIHFVQPLFDGFLLACARSHWRSELDIEHNGRLYSRTGQLERELILGDGIEWWRGTAPARSCTSSPLRQGSTQWTGATRSMRLLTRIYGASAQRTFLSSTSTNHKSLDHGSCR